MASPNPAYALRLGGTVGHGAPQAADFILLDDDLQVMETWVAGEQVFRA